MRGTPEVGVPGTGVSRVQSCLTESEAASPAYCCTCVLSVTDINIIESNSSFYIFYDNNDL